LHIGNGIFIGFGTALIVLEFAGWLSTNYLFTTLSSMFQGLGIDINQNYLIRYLSNIALYNIVLIGAGVFSLLFGAIREWRYSAR
jgi:hypothetical protein